MNAVVAYGKHDYRYEQVDVPKVGAGELLLQVEACGVCAGDIKCFEGGFRFWGGEGNPPYCEPPFIPGHEFIGRIAEIGPGYTGGLSLGDRVAVEQIVPCGECPYCKSGQYWLCGPHDVFGFKGKLNGGFADYVLVPKNAFVYPIPESLPIASAALIEPYACGMHAVDRAAITADDVVVIAGAGTLGLSMITAASRLHPRALISIDPVERLQNLALSLGATHAMDAWTKDELPELIHNLTAGAGCDVYIEASGHNAAIAQGLNLIRKGGRFVEFSVFAGPAKIDWSIIGDAKELNIYGSSLSPNCFPRSINGIVSGELKTDGVVTHILPLADFQNAFSIAKAHESIKIILVP